MSVPLALLTVDHVPSLPNANQYTDQDLPWRIFGQVKSYLADTEHKIVKADSGGKVTGGNDEMY